MVKGLWLRLQLWRAYHKLDKLVDRNSQLLHEQNRLLRELEELKTRGNQ